MDARDLFAAQLDLGAFQVGKVFQDFPSDGWDKKVNDQSMSPKETVAHLTECYTAASEHLNGEQHNWGTYQPVSDDPQRLLAEMKKQWDVMKTAALAAEPAEYNNVLAYTTNHDCYHVGQMCALRLTLQPDWDAYCIYA